MAKSPASLLQGTLDLIVLQLLRSAAHYSIGVTFAFLFVMVSRDWPAMTSLLFGIGLYLSALAVGFVLRS